MKIETKSYLSIEPCKGISDDNVTRVRINSSLKDIKQFLVILKKEILKKKSDLKILMEVTNELVFRLPIPIRTLEETFVLRCRPNFNGEIFSKRAEISYNPNEEICKLGRFNLDGESVFYGAIADSSKNSNSALTSICESYKYLLDTNNDTKYQYLTIGKWDVIKPIRVAVLTFFGEAEIKSDSIQNINPLFLNILSNLCSKTDQEKCTLFYNFFS